MPQGGRWPLPARRHCAQHKVIHAITGLDAGAIGTIRLSQMTISPHPLSPFVDVLERLPQSLE